LEVDVDMGRAEETTGRIWRADGGEFMDVE